MTRRLAPLVLVCLFLALPVTAEKAAWVEVRSANFIVVSNAGQKEAENTAAQFEQIRAIFRKAMPFAQAEQNPIITIVAVKDEKSLRDLLPEYWAKGHTHPAGLYFSRMNKHYIALRTDFEEPNALESVYHEYFHFITLPYFPHLPLWVAEGLADFYGNTDVNGKGATLGNPDISLIEQLRDGRMMPLKVLFSVDQNSPYYNEQNKTTLFYAESWAVIHYLMVGDKEAYRPMFIRYLQLTANGVESEDAARQAFGDLDQFQKRIQRYISQNQFYSLTMKNLPDAGAKNFPSRVLPPAEADALRGDFEVYRGSEELARTWIRQAEQEDPKLALPHESSGMLSYFKGHREDALEEISKAIALDPQNAMTYFDRAFLESQSGSAITGNDQIETDLRRSIALNANFPPAYATLANVLAARGEKLDEALADAKKAQAIEPGNPLFAIAVAQVLLRMGRVDNGVKLAIDAQQMARDPEERAMAASFLSFAQMVQKQGGTNGTVRFAVRVPQTPRTSDPDAAPAPSATVNGTSSANVEDETEAKKSASEDTGGSPKSGAATNSTIETAPPAGVQLKIKTRPPETASNASAGSGSQSEKSGESAAAATGSSGAAGDRPKALDATPPLGSRASDESSYSDEGRVVKATCDGNALKIVLDVGGLSLVLAADDYSKIKIVPPKAVAGFRVCTQLAGRKARVVYGTNTEAGIDGVLFEVDAE